MNYWIYPGLEYKAKIFALNAEMSSQVNLNGILDCCCFVFEVTPEEMRSPSRVQKLAFARHAFVKIARDTTNMSYRAISEYIGRRNHATVVHSARTAQDLIETDQIFRNQYNKVIALSIKATRVKEAAELLKLQVI